MTTYKVLLVDDEEEVRRVLAEEYAQEVAQGMAQEIVEKAAKEAAEKAFAEGEQSMMINQIIKKVKKSKTLETIASELEEEVADIKPIYDVVIAAAPDYNIDIIKNKLAINKKYPSPKPMKLICIQNSRQPVRVIL